MATGKRTKSTLKRRPKYKQVRSLKDRKQKAKKAAAHKRGLGRSKKKRQLRGKAGGRVTRRKAARAS